MSGLKPHEINIDILSGELVYEPSPNFSYSVRALALAR